VDGHIGVGVAEQQVEQDGSAAAKGVACHDHAVVRVLPTDAFDNLTAGGAWISAQEEIEAALEGKRRQDEMGQWSCHLFRYK